MKKYGIIAAFIFTACVFNVQAEDPKPVDSLWVKTGEDVVKDVAKTFVKECLTMPVINFAKDNLQKVLFPKCAAQKAQAKKAKKDTKEILTLATQINQLKLAGVDKKVINALSVKLANKIQAVSITECPCKK